MDRLVSCEFNMDTACVELKFFDGSIIAITPSPWKRRLPTICISGQNWII